MGDPYAGLISTGTQTLGLVSRYLAQSNQADAQDALAALAHEYGAEAIAEQMSSSEAVAIIGLLQARLGAARTAEAIAALQAEITTMRAVHDATLAREARTRRILWGAGAVLVGAGAVGGLWLALRRRRH